MASGIELSGVRLRAGLERLTEGSPAIASDLIAAYKALMLKLVKQSSNKKLA